MWLLACSEQNFTDARWTDSFRQDAANAVDLLVVVDTSCSMRAEQDNLARNFASLLDRFVEAGVDWQIAVATTDLELPEERGRLQGGDDELILRGPDGELDRVTWDRTWEQLSGVSMVLSADATSPLDNDNRGNWCLAGETYGEGERGSPGVHARRCSGLAQERLPPGPDTGERAPVFGDLVITEIHNTALGPDARCEWIEISSTAADTVQLAGLELSDLGRNVAILPAYSLAPVDSVVIGRDLDACGAPVDLVLTEGFTLNDPDLILSGDLDAVSELFAENVAQGTRGSGIELGLEGARLTFEEPAYSQHNESWLRDDAKLALLFVSDEDDLSPLSVDDYIAYLYALKGVAGHRDPARVTVSAVVATERPPREDLASCDSANGRAYYGERYLAAADRTGGLAESICADDFAPIVSDVGLTLTGLDLVFALSRTPVVDTLEVDLFGDTDLDSFIETLVLDVDYVYDADRNAILFDTDTAPPPDTHLRVRYQIAAGSP